ncbi:3-dehydroquinate synthase [Pseudomonadota bacterium]
MYRVCRGGFGITWYMIGVMALVITSFVLFEQQTQLWIDSTAESLSRSGQGEGWLIPLFIISLLTFDVLLPIPSSVVAVFSATSLGFSLGAVSVWLGLMLGSCFGYLIGASSQQWVLKRWVGDKDYQRSRQLADKMGAAALVMMRGVPVLAETSVIAAGMVRYPIKKFILITALANAGLAAAFAYVGAQAGIKESFLLVLAGSIAIPSLAWLLKSAWQRLGAGADFNIDSQQAITDIKQISADFNVAYQYPVLFENNVFNSNNPCLSQILNPWGQKSNKAVFVFVDQGVIDANPALITKITAYFEQLNPHVYLLAAPVAVVGGEAAKTQTQIESFYQTLLLHKVDRHNVVIAIGGGAVLDAVGYACATFHRGIGLLRMPSTVLAQNDAGVGVKNGFNAANTKNLIGSFCPPLAVVNDASLLTNLAARDKRAGLAEAVKVAAIRSESFFVWLEERADKLARFEPHSSQYAIARCAELHLKQISQAGDPFESGNARPLDYGHWLAHKLEALANYQIRHGEAVAIGMALDAYYAAAVGLLPVEQANRLSCLLEKLGFDLWHPALNAQSENSSPIVFEGLEEFRQHLGGELCITLLTRIGVGREVNHIDSSHLLSALQQLRHRHGEGATTPALSEQAEYRRNIETA